MKNNSKNVYDIVIYLLFLILICILFYSFIKLMYLKLSVNPRNSTNVSSIAELNLQTSPNLLYEVTYCDINPDSTLNELSSANIIYEYLSMNSTPIYKGIFEVAPNSVNNSEYKSSVIKKSQIPVSLLYTDSKSIIGTNVNANFIFSKLFYNHVSNFIYKNGFYIHYLTEHPQLDYLNNKEISVSNVIIQLVNEPTPSNYSTGNGDGYLCTKGRVQKIKWKKDSNATKFFYKNGTELFNITGTTWWIISNYDAEFLFN